MNDNMTNRELADAIELLTITDAFSSSPFAIDLFKFIAKRLKNEKLRPALILAKDMMIANDLILPKTFEVIDEALNT